MSKDPGENAEKLAWELPRVDADVGREVPDDDRLRAYREGALSELEARRLEWILSRNAAARTRLTELAGVKLAAPPRRVRRRVLGGPASRWAQLAAAVVAAAALTWGGMHWFEWRGATPASFAPLPADLEYDVRVEGLATDRSHADELFAHPATPVRIVVEPRQDAFAGLEFGVYRLEGSTLVRLVTGDSLTVTAGRGAATLSAPAARLVGPRPGRRDFFVVIARAGALPPGGELRERPAADWLAAATGGRVYRRSLTILQTRSDP